VIKVMEYIEENAKLQREFEMQFGLNERNNTVNLTQESEEEKSPDNSPSGEPVTPLQHRNAPCSKDATPYPLSAFKTPCDTVASPANTYYTLGKAVYGNEYNDGPGVDPTESVVDEAFKSSDPPEVKTSSNDAMRTSMKYEDQGEGNEITPTEKVDGDASQRKHPPELLFPKAECVKVSGKQEGDEESINEEGERIDGDRKMPSTVIRQQTPRKRWADEDSESSEERAVLSEHEPIPSRLIQYEDMNMPTAIGEIVVDQHHEMSNLTVPGEIATPSTASKLEPANLNTSFQNAKGKNTDLKDGDNAEQQTPMRRVQPSRTGKKIPVSTIASSTTPAPTNNALELPEAPQPKRKIYDHFGRKASSTGKKKDE